jgi:hypothetical protein
MKYLCSASSSNTLQIRLRQCASFNNSYYVIVFTDQKFKGSLTGQFWYRVSHEVAVRMSGRAKFIWGLGWGWSLCAKELLSCYWLEMSSSTHVSLHEGSWVSSTFLLHDPRSQDGRHKVFYDLSLEVTACHIYNILQFTPISSTDYKRRLPKYKEYQEVPHWEKPCNYLLHILSTSQELFFFNLLYLHRTR